jgi:NAD(P)H dehydrogenase (quinone)
MIAVGLPYTEQRLRKLAEITGGTPYGATTFAGIDGSRQPTKTSSPSRAFRAGM